MSDENIKIEKHNNDDEISLMNLFAVIVKRWKFIFFSSLKATPDAAFNKLPNIYRSEVIARQQESFGSSSQRIFKEGLKVDYAAETGLLRK